MMPRHRYTAHAVTLRLVPRALLIDILTMPAGMPFRGRKPHDHRRSIFARAPTARCTGHARADDIASSR